MDSEQQAPAAAEADKHTVAPANKPRFCARQRRAISIATLVLVPILFISALVLSPLPSSLTQVPYATMLLARDGRLLGAQIAADQQWRFAPVTQLPEKYRQALLLFEDRYFYQHPGINPLAIGRALKANIAAGHVVSGGSTLSMQLARLLRNAEQGERSRRNLGNKLLEAWLALQLEWHFSKDELLCLYASQAPFGGNVVGLRAAAWRYFGRAPERLSWAESALLAVLPNSPALMHPGRQRSLLQHKRDSLLQRLQQQQLLSDLDLQLALLEPLPDRPQALPQLAAPLLSTLSQQYPTTSVLATTLDADLQVRVQQLVHNHSPRLANEGAHNIAVVVIDNQQQEARVYIGNEAWQQLPQYAPSLDIAQRPRSTGSILKPLLYGLMLQEGMITPKSLIPDIPSQFGGYSPQNYDRTYRGAVPAQFALAHSLNIPAVRMLRRYGIGRLQRQLQLMGMTTLQRPADDYGLTLILGGAEGSLWELTSIYARLAASARSGVAQVPRLLAATPQAPKEPAETKPLAPFPLKQGAAWLTLDALVEVARPGNDNYWRDFAGSQTIAWKTGTSYGLRDAWAIGSNSRYSVGVWVGNAGGEAASFISGQTSAAPILFDVFDTLGKVNWFNKPEAALQTLQVCADDGYLAGGQCATESLEIPRESHFAEVTPNHRRIHLDASEQFRVHAQCEAVSAMHTKDWLVLPPVQEFYWRQHHSDYRSLPPWRKDCLDKLGELDDDQPMALVYPYEQSRVYIPRDLNGLRSRVVLKAVHRAANAKIYWHLDDDYLGETTLFHERQVSLEPGLHSLLLLDDQGHRLTRRFRVLGAEDKGG